MHPLNFPTYRFRVKNNENGPQIFDVARRKFVALQAEEWVRQHALHYLIYEKKYPLSLINVEKQVHVARLKKRVDIVVFDTSGTVHILVECKAHDVKITQEAFDQTARYNRGLQANYLWVTNGLQHYYCQMDLPNQTYHFVAEIPDFSR